MINTAVQYRLLSGFDDESLLPQKWNALLAKGSSDVIFLTWQWQKAWWETFGREQLLLIAAEQDGEPIAIAPLFADNGMIYFVGSGGSDYLDFIGDISDAEVLEALLQTAVAEVYGFLGFRFYHIPESSCTHQQLAEVANRLGWGSFEEGEIMAPMMDLKAFPEQTYQAIRKKSLQRHEGWFAKNGGYEVEHLGKYQEVLPHLETFFQQHIDRWSATTYPSLFHDLKQRQFYHRLTTALAEEGWLRFTHVVWQGKNIAYHFGFHYRNSFFWYKPTFDISLSKHSPGEVLLRQLLLLAIKEEAHVFDFGLGDEAFKQRFATRVCTVKNHGIYSSSTSSAIN